MVVDVHQMAKSSDICIGIDLGTTYSCVGYWNDANNRVEIIPNDMGNMTTPSVVSFSSEELLVGDAAKSQASSNPQNTIYEVKRLMGRKFSDKLVQDDLKQYLYTVVRSDDDRPMIEVEYKGETKRFYPEQISAYILGYMKRIAEQYLGKEVKRAVITVPAYFDDAQRNATKDAGHIAGLEVMRIINEPTAAALAYGLDKKSDTETNILIFDFGGGTHDTTLLCVADGVFEVKSTHGNAHLGGADIDNRLVDFCREEFKKKNKKSLDGDLRALRRLRTACESAKKTLSAAMSAMIDVDALHAGIDFSINITRAKLDDLCMDIFRQTLDPLDVVITGAKMDKKKVNEVVLVGGSSRIPRVQQLLSDYFNGKELNKSVNPDECVAFGAAVQAGILSGHTQGKLNNLILLDVTPLSLGIETAGNTMVVLIGKNTTIPTKKTQVFSTFSDNQSEVSIKIFEGERARTRDNHLLGEFSLTGIAPAPRGVPQIEITYNVDANNILTVEAIDKTSGMSKNMTIKSSKERLSQEQIDRMTADAAQYAKEDDEYREKVEHKNKLENFVYTTKSQVNMDEYKTKMSEGSRKKITDKCEEVIRWMDDLHETLEYDDKYKEFEQFVQPIFAELQNNSGDDNGDGGSGGVSGNGMTPDMMQEMLRKMQPSSSSDSSNKTSKKSVAVDDVD